MTKPKTGEVDMLQLLKQMRGLRAALSAARQTLSTHKADDTEAKRFVALSRLLVADLQQIREEVSPVRFGSIGITLGRSDSIAKFFAFSFINQEKRDLDQLVRSPFYGAGVYAIYYLGKTETDYLPISGTETPIYVGKANPKNYEAETVEEQGQALYKRLMEHVKNINRTELVLSDFVYRAAPIQSGMQAAVEEFMIRLFHPIWNKETKICFGIGKHGDAATTRGNKRSPWDTMHPGRKWAKATKDDQTSQTGIKVKIAAHFTKHPAIANKEALFKMLSLA